ncbi:MAG: EpsG family protein, partial [Acidobacteria bacterium]|nr:EpsG family protein [Acidobacteriota bacterium]
PLEQRAETISKPRTSAGTKPVWREYLETEEATRAVYLVFGLIAITMLLAFLQFRTEAICCGDWDGYYHIRWSQLLWENFSSGRWLPKFEWLPLTVLNSRDYADHHFLFHLLQIPFLWFFEPVMAAKIAAVTFSSLAVFSVYWLLYQYEVKYQLIWLLAILTCANMFFYRMNMAKAPPLTIIITIIGIYLLFERKYVWLLPLMFAFVWTYSLFPLLWFAAAIWTIIILWNERRFEWRPVAYTTVGMILGNLINPYFPQNLILFWEHFYTKFRVGTDFAVSVGGEWYPYDGMQLLTHFPVALLAMLLGYILWAPRNGKLPEKATFFLMFVSILLAAQFRSKRFAEYFPPFAILFGAFSWQAFMLSSKPELPEDVQRELKPYLDADNKSNRQNYWDAARTAGVWTLGIFLSFLFLLSINGFPWPPINQPGLTQDIRNNDADDRYRRAMQWATGTSASGAENIPAGERIFNCNWDDFPKLFFLNTKHNYVYGLDPNYLFSENPELYKTLQDITAAKVDDAGPVIREKFGARFVFADAKENDEMIAKLLESGWADMVYEDDEARILKIRDVKGDPPKDAVDDAPETPEEKQLLDDQENKADGETENNDENAH